MREAVIVSVARTPIGKAYRGAYNDTDAAVLSGHVAAEVVRRANIDPTSVEDVIIGCASQQGNQSYNIGRLTVAAAGLPKEVAGMSLDRQCSSGLAAIATAAKQIVMDGMDVVIAGGVENISLTQTKHKSTYRTRSAAVEKNMPHMWMAMIETAEIVADRYGISREAQDEFSLQSQQRTTAAQRDGRFAVELAPLSTRKAITNKDTNEVTYEDVFLLADEGPRSDTTLAGLAKLQPVFKDGTLVKQGKHVTARLRTLPPATMHAPAIQRVLTNLINNALRHGGDEVTVETAEDHGRARISVLDRGPGIPETEVERMLQPFTRLNSARSTTGSGLGLAIVDRIVKMHNGTIRLLPRADGGLEARVELPL